ncbi:MAG: hypothetical protein HC851_14110 [Acaryochloris sp. RU_4_1]|nr:hypothetical protein [Acaryochloris sp. SU_5_25]NJM66705.1 hypothetical protein [Acaryochloris sp. RU_4_1]NJN37836.1 hypothetical protein [Acaryochloridaceae cyanobacterium CSU_3_4]NJR55525.1 hypothetical protein [Acaryochloris sp. CRU_2_0]
MNDEQTPSHSSADGAALEGNLDPRLLAEIERLHQLTLYSRWLVVGILWLTVGSISLWSLRDSIQLWLEYFTWSAVKYALVYNRIAAIGLGICMGTTLAVLIRQSRIILWGLPNHEHQRLSHQVLRIRVQGRSHPLWKWVCRE